MRDLHFRPVPQGGDAAPVLHRQDEPQDKTVLRPVTQAVGVTAIGRPPLCRPGPVCDDSAAAPLVLMLPSRESDHETAASDETPERPESQQDERLHDGRRLRVMLVDDHRIVRQGLAGLLRVEDDLEVVGEASDGQMAIDLADRLRPDVVLMDISMPRVNGIEATRRIAARHPDIRIVGLSMHEQADMARAMHDAGAAAYVPKDGPTEALLDAIRGRG